MPRHTSLANTLKNYLYVTVGYILLTIILPANKIALHDYKLTPFHYHLLLLLVTLPLYGIWFAAFYGYARIRQYGSLVSDTQEGKHFVELARGFTLLAWGMTLSSIIILLLNAIANAKPGFHPASIIIANYLSLAVPILSFLYISTASRGLLELHNVRVKLSGERILLLVFLIIGIVYCSVVFKQLDLHHLSSTDNPFFLPTWLMLATVVLPSLYAWFIGLKAAYELNVYSHEVQGLLYRKAMGLLSFGILGVVASSVGIQYLHIATPRTGHLSLNSALLIVNITYVFMAAGYSLLSVGASRLKKIEEV